MIRLKMLLLAFIFTIVMFSIVLLLQAQSEVVFRYGELETPETLEPTTASKMVERRISQLIFESLIEEVYDPVSRQRRYQNVLTTSFIPSPDGLSYECRLAGNVRWADGHPFNSRDVLGTMRILTHPETELFDPQIKAYLNSQDSKAPMARTVQIQFNHNFYDPYQLLTFKIIPFHAARPESHLTKYSRFAKQPIGTGPYVYKEKAGPIYRFERNPHYGQRANRRSQPYMARVELETYADLGAMDAALEARRMDLATERSPLAVVRDQGSSDRTLVSYNSRTIYFLAYNQREDVNTRAVRLALRNPTFRKAVTHIIDREELLRVVYQGGSGGQAHVVITGPFPRNTPLYNDNVQRYAYNKPKAERLFRQVLEALGYTKDDNDKYWTRRGRTFTLTLKYMSAGDEADRVCQYIKDQLESVGIQLRLVRRPEAAWYNEVYNEHDFDIVFHSYSLGPTLNIRPLFDSRQTGPGQSNFSGFVDPDVDQAVAEIYHTMAPGTMQQLAHRAHALIHERCVFTFLFQLDKYAAYWNTLENVQIHPYYLFSNIGAWRKVE